MIWSCSCLIDPLEQGILVQATCDVAALLPEGFALAKDMEESHVIRSAVADFLARRIATDKVATLDDAVVPGRRRRKRIPAYSAAVPYVLERSDIWCSQKQLKIMVRVKETSEETAMQLVRGVLDDWTAATSDRMVHIACCVLQHRIRIYLKTEKLVAFVANGSILPRKSGVSHAPMASPPAVPFVAPNDTDLSRTIVIEMGDWKPYCPLTGSLNGVSEKETTMSSVSIAGMVIPEGITLIVGGGYHGKSTLLRTIAAGVYNKIPGDGRELCVTVSDAVTVRAEDGRYVNNCNVSAFISNLPTLPGIANSLDTKQFSTREASGSTSQAANVSEAIEMGATAMLVDEDVSAANFMARDGRMRSLVMDESITPLLYRVNGMYQTLGISSIVVVGGVGDWLDVPHKVILLDKYVASDATAKANSISRQFSYGHVQYAGRGVVHRLQWDKEGTPIPRRPTAACVTSFGPNLSVSVVEGNDMLSIERDVADDMQDEEDDSGYIDMSRCEQLLGKKAQLFGCGLCLAWILEHAQRNPDLGVAELLEALHAQLMDYGIVSLTNQSMIESIGVAYQPRKYEVFMALTRMRGVVLENMPIKDDDAEAEAAREEERKKQELADLWNARRKNNRFVTNL